MFNTAQEDVVRLSELLLLQLTLVPGFVISGPEPCECSYFFTVQLKYQAHLHIASSVGIEVGLSAYERQLNTLLSIHANTIDVQPFWCPVDAPITQFLRRRGPGFFQIVTVDTSVLPQALILQP